MLRKNMRKKTFKEGRKYQRLKIKLPITYCLAARGRYSKQKLLTRDISGGGVGLKTGYRLKKGTPLKVLMYFPKRKEPILADSRVVWCKKIKKTKGYNIGIKHIKIALKDREAFIFCFCETMIDFLGLPISVVNI
jgi:c-di-GMP-binding flagellar brake protein YcgR